MSKLIEDLLKNVPVPQMVRVRQRFDDTALENIGQSLATALSVPGTMDRIQPGQQVAIAVGSRGIANISTVAKGITDAVKRAGAHPFFVPCMGSHGGATAAGQAEVLHHLGISEETMGVPIRSSMEVLELDRLTNGLPVYVDRYAAQADAVIVVNRVKPHTAFRGPIESGMMKMIAIGLGKQKGAEACHQLGFKHMAENVPKVAGILLQKLPIVFGVALVENAYDRTCLIEAVPAELIFDRECELLKIAREKMPRILFDPIDVLVVDYMGKNISGDGMDPNITGRYPTPYAYGGPEVSKLVVLDLTKESNGNANGLGAADLTTQRLVNKIDRAGTYVNGLTSTLCGPTKIAMVMENDLLAIKAAVKTCNILDFTQCRMVRIRDTLHLGEIEISVPMLEEATRLPDVEVLTDKYDLDFDINGNLF